MDEHEGWGYPTDEPCVVCGTTEDCQSEPRFGYSVCRKHKDISPVEISRMKGVKI